MRQAKASTSPSPIRQRLAELFGADPRSLALLRISLALIILCDLVLRSRDMQAHYTDAGVMPRTAFVERFANKWTLCLHLASGHWPLQAFLFAVTGVAAMAMLVGWRTRFATFATWLLVCSMQARNPLIIQGGDILLRVVMFWAIFLPLGARASVDRLIADRDAGAGAAPGSGEPAAPTRVLSIASVALFLQLAMVYWFTAILKDSPDWRSDGTAIYYALSADQYATVIGHWLLAYPGLLTVLTFAVFWFEVMGPFFLLSPWLTGPVRTLGVFGFIGLHFGVLLCIDLGLFPFISSSTMLCFLPAWFWDRALPRFPRLVARVTGAGRVVARWLMRVVGARRGSAPYTRLGRPAQLLCGVVLAYVILWNLSTVPAYPYELPEQARFLGPLLRMDQRWDMFAPRPLRNDGWYVIPGQLVDGSVVDLFRGGQPVSWDKPARGTYENQRWRKYMMNLRSTANRGQRLFYGRWLCRTWNASHHGDRRLETLEIFFTLERTPPPGGTTTTDLKSLWKHRCVARSAAELAPPPTEPAPTEPREDPAP